MSQLRVQRKAGESIMLGDHVEVRVNKIEPGTGLISVTVIAPSYISIHRKEVYRGNKEAVQ